MKRYPVVLTPSFEKEIKKIKDKKQLQLILKGKEKIAKLGLNALDPLYVRENFLLGEIKYKKPPYRLYVIYDKSNKVFYLITWKHKEKHFRLAFQWYGESDYFPLHLTYP